MPDASAEPQAANYPHGDYAIVEFFGHQMMVGRIEEVERFGQKLLAVEPIFQNVLLPAVLHGGAAIFRITGCTAEQAFKNQPRSHYSLPAPVRFALPPAMLEAPADPCQARPETEPDDDEEVLL